MHTVNTVSRVGTVHTHTAARVLMCGMIGTSVIGMRMCVHLAVVDAPQIAVLVVYIAMHRRFWRNNVGIALLHHGQRADAVLGVVRVVQDDAHHARHAQDGLVLQQAVEHFAVRVLYGV